jgi:O-antigen ligase
MMSVRFSVRFGMTTSLSNELNSVAIAERQQAAIATKSSQRVVYRIRHTLASRFVFLTICVAIVVSALAYGTVHYWALTLFNLGALVIVILWVVDAWDLRTFRISRNALQLPLVGVLALGFIQLLPLSNVVVNGLSVGVIQTLSLDANSTRLVLVQLSSLLIYFSATLVFIDTPHRLHVLVRTILIFGFCLAVFGLTQSIATPNRVYWVRELTQSTAFGPFINRHHFAGYMELTIALPLGLLFGGAIAKEKRLLYSFAAGLMGVALIMTTSRGGIISLVAEIFFFVAVTSVWRPSRRQRRSKKGRIRSAAIRLGSAVALLVTLFAGVLFFGGEFSIYRIIDSVNTDDPTTGRAHFWSVTLGIIRAHPILGTGLGAFGVVYPQFDTRSGLFRLEQAHNDYLQILSDAGIVGGILALSFIVLLFRRAFHRMRSKDEFRRAIALGAAGGCLAVLVHSLFDFTLHTTSNALLFLVLAAVATMNGRIEHVEHRSKRRHRSDSHSSHDRKVSTDKLESLDSSNSNGVN